MNIDKIEEAKIRKLTENLELHPVLKSSNVRGMAYDENNKIMVVGFGNKEDGIKSKYAYTNVDKNTFDTITHSNGIGKKLSELVIKRKDLYKYIKL